MAAHVAVQPFLPFDAEEVPSQSRLVEELGRICAESALEEKVFVAPSLPIGYQTVERLARSGRPWINLRVETVRTLAHALVGPELAREGIRLLSRAQALMLVEQACSETLDRACYFGQLRDRPGLHRAFQRTFDELRSAGITSVALPRPAFADLRKHRELTAILRRYETALAQGRLIDRAGVLRRAADHLERGSPPDAALYLIPEALELSSVERTLIERLSGGRIGRLAEDRPEAWKSPARGAEIFRALGEENEIREVFRRILREGIPFDEVEILHTDPSAYPALVWELANEQGIPCTFAGGIAVSFSRPGRAAFAFLDWIGRDFEADVLREALASPVLTLRGLGESGLSADREAARAFREARIGWGRARHLACLDRLIAAREQPPQPSGEEDHDEEQRRGRHRARRLAGARLARAFAARALALVPEGSLWELQALAAGTRAFVTEFSRVSSELDGTALSALQALFRELEEARPASQSSAATASERLHDAVASLHIDADRPRPGRVHVAFYPSGGFSGRRHTYLVGVDEARHPGRDLEDPVLLDEERRRINDGLPSPLLALGRERPREAATALKACVARLRGELTASYSSWNLRNLSQAGEQSASPFLLALFRETTGRAEAGYDDLARALPSACGFVPGEDRALDETDWWLSRFRRTGVSRGAAAPVVRACYPWLADGRLAVKSRESDEWTAYDGWVASGAPELDPRHSREPISCSKVQTLARCPFAYFLRHVLRVEPPEELRREPARWLEPKDEGSLLHDVFRFFFERITAAGEKPSFEKHLPLIESIAEENIRAWRERTPARSEIAFSEQREGILFACRTLLSLEEKHCSGVTPRYFEIPFGLTRTGGRAEIASPEPVEISLGGGESIRLRGSIDRADEAPDGSFHLWDYKTGSGWDIQEAADVHGGRQIQYALYAMAFEALLERAGRAATVSRSGYLLPGRKGEGRRMEMLLDAASTRQVLRRLLDMLRDGFFPHAVSENDCRYCDFEPICGGAKRASERAKAKLATTGNPVLIAFREIHDLEA